MTLELLAPEAVAARRRPLAVLFVWAWQTAWAWAIAWPVGRVIASIYGTHPDGDGVLFRPGALELSELVMSAQRATPALSGHAVALIPLGIFLGLVPLAALLFSLSSTDAEGRAPRARDLREPVANAFRPLALLLVAFGLVFTLLTVLAVSAGAVTWLIDATWARQHAEQAATVVGIGLLFLVVGILHDLARAALVRHRVSVLAAIHLAWLAFHRRPLAAVWHYAWRGLVGWLVVVLAAMVATRLGGRAGFALAALALVHQVAIAARIALRASWLARAIRAVDAVKDSA
jgi:hypothetical protein